MKLSLLCTADKNIKWFSVEVHNEGLTYSNGELLYDPAAVLMGTNLKHFKTRTQKDIWIPSAIIVLSTKTKIVN